MIYTYTPKLNGEGLQSIIRMDPCGISLCYRYDKNEVANIPVFNDFV